MLARYKPLNNDRQRGAVTALAMLMIALIVITVLTITLTGANTALDDSLKQKNRLAALYLAESGLEYALYQLDSASAACDATLVSSVNLAGESFNIAAGQTTDFDGSPLPANRCRVSVSANATSGAVRNIEAVMAYGGGGGIALDSISSRGGNNRASLSWDHTFTGTNGLLIVAVAYRNDTSISSVTYGGNALSQVTAVDAGADIRVEQWYLAAPLPGTNSVVVTMGAQTRLMAGAVSLTGVNPISPIVASASSADTTGSIPQLNISIANSGSWVIDSIGMRGQVGVPTPDTAQNLLWSDSTNGNAGNPRVLGGASSQGPVSSGTISMQWSASTVPWAMAAVVIDPAGTGNNGVVAWRELVSP